MSQETIEWLNTMTLIGFSEKRGEAWHYRKSAQGAEPNHYVGAIPLGDVERRLFDWEPVKVPMQYTLNGVLHTAPNRVVIAHSKTGADLGVFRPTYQPHGYQQWLVDNVSTILDTSHGDLQVGSAGLLKGGGVAWVQFEMEETHEVAGVKFRPFFTSATSLDGSLATTYNTGAQIVVCDNTLSANLADKSHQIKIRHSSKSLGALTDIRDALGVVIGTTEDVMAEIYALANETVTSKVWGNFLDSLAKVEPGAKGRAATLAANKRAALENLWAKDERVAPWSGTAYGVVAAMNTYDQHLAHVRGMSRPERNALNMVKGEFEKSDAATLTVLRAVQDKRRALEPAEVKALVKA